MLFVEIKFNKEKTVIIGLPEICVKCMKKIKPNAPKTYFSCKYSFLFSSFRGGELMQLYIWG